MKIKKNQLWLIAGLLIAVAVAISYALPANKQGAILPTPTATLAVANAAATPTAVYIAVNRGTATPSPLNTEMNATAIPTTPLPVIATSTPLPSNIAAASPTVASPTTALAIAPTFDPNMLASPTLPPAFTADFGRAENFSPYTIGEGDINLTANAGVLRCRPLAGGDGSAELWLAPSGSPTIPAGSSVMLTARMRSQGEPIGLIFDYTPAGGQVLRLSGTRSNTAVAVDEYVGNGTRYPGDGHFGTAGQEQVISHPFTGEWHSVQLTLTASNYQLQVDDNGVASGARSGSGGQVMLYATCDGAEFDHFAIETSEQKL